MWLTLSVVVCPVSVTEFTLALKPSQKWPPSTDDPCDCLPLCFPPVLSTVVPTEANIHTPPPPPPPPPLPPVSLAPPSPLSNGIHYTFV